MLCPHCCYVLTLTEYPESDVQLNIATVTFVTSLAMSTAFHRLGVSAVSPSPPSLSELLSGAILTTRRDQESADT